jgi:hypothetical protein
MAGCIDMSGSNFSNIGNGNSASNFGNGNSASNIGNGNNGTIGINPGGDSGKTNAGPSITGVRLNHDRYSVYRINNFDPSRYRYDSGSQQIMLNNNFYPSPSPDPYLPILNPNECIISATALSNGSPTFEIAESPDWEWFLPQGVEMVNINSNGPMSRMLVARPEAATGMYTLRVEYRPDRNIKALATLKVLDQGAVQVEF